MGMPAPGPLSPRWDTGPANATFWDTCRMPAGRVALGTQRADRLAICSSMLRDPTSTDEGYVLAIHIPQRRFMLRSKYPP